MSASEKLVKTNDHEIVSIYPFSDEEVDTLMTHAGEAVLMWATKDGWPVGVTHAYVWKDGKIWLTFAAHRHRAAAIRRDPRVSVNVSSASYGERMPKNAPFGAITFKGTVEFFDDDETKAWFYPALAKKVNPNNPDGEEFFNELLDSPTRTIIAVTPVKKIMYNSGLAGRHMQGTVKESELGDRLESDKVRMNRLREERGLETR
ncbi:MAG: pyridoxamine 5'-phosphate oxidase family protein [Pseudomonadota bacterium]